jgi:hypothetical protein
MHVQERVPYPARGSRGGSDRGWSAMTHDSGIYNGMPATGLGDVVWHKSVRSGPQGNCVEFADVETGGRVAVRNSRDPHGPALIYTRAEIHALIEGAKDGDFDHLLA